MSFYEAIRLTEILLGLAFVQQSLEHLRSLETNYKIFIPRLILSVLLIVGFQTGWVVTALLVLAIISLVRFQGPYNGGADRMGVLILFSLFLVHVVSSPRWQEIAFGYLALQLVFSYFFAGWVKIKNPDWRSGIALAEVFEYSNYPVSESLRKWSKSTRLLLYVSWIVIVFELLFPFSLFYTQSLVAALILAAIFHFSNACFFGLNRFFWVWIAAYPSILWLQSRLFPL